MSSSLEKLFETSKENFDKQIIDIKTLTTKYNWTITPKDNKKIKSIKINDEIEITSDIKDKIVIGQILSVNCNQIKTYCTLMKTTQQSTIDILNNALSKINTLQIDEADDQEQLNKRKNLFTKIYFLLNNIEILFLFDTMDYKLMTRILNRNNFISDVSYKKACFIAMVVFEMWSLVKYDGNELNENDYSFYNQLENYLDISDNYKDVKRNKRIHDLIHEIKNDARDFVKSSDFDYALQHNTFEIEIPKRNLDNIIKPMDEIKQSNNINEFKSFGFSLDQPIYDGNILPSGIHGGVKRIQGGDKEKLDELKNAYENQFKIDNNNGPNQTRFLFNCLLTANVKGATNCMTTLSVSTAKIDSYKIVETLPRATLVKLATILGIQFSNGKIETYPEWIKRIKNEDEFKDDDLLNENGEVKMTLEINDPGKKRVYKKLILIHYIGQVIIDKLGGKNVEYDILKAQNKAKIQFTKITGPEVSYRTKSNYSNFRSNSHSLSLSSNPIFMNMNLYSQQSPEQLDRIKSGIMTGGVSDAQIYSSNVYEKAITQALNKYKSMGFKIDPNDMNVIDQTIEKLKDVEVRILDTYSDLMNVLQFSTMRNNPSFMASLSEEEKKRVEEAWNNKDPKKILELKQKLDKELKEKQILADNAHTILDVIFPWKKSLEETMNKNTKELKDTIASSYVKKEDLDNIVKKNDLDNIVKKSDLDNLVKNGILTNNLIMNAIKERQENGIDSPVFTQYTEQIVNQYANSLPMTEAMLLTMLLYNVKQINENKVAKSFYDSIKQK